MSLGGEIDLSCCAPGSEGVRIPPRMEDKMIPFVADHVDGDLQLLVAESLYGSEVYSSSSPWLKEVIEQPRATISSGLAQTKGLQTGDMVKITWPKGHIQLSVTVAGSMSDTTVVITRIRGSVTDGMVPGGGVVSCEIEKLEGDK